MMLDKILENVTEACQAAIKEDDNFMFFQEKFYEIIREYPQEDLFALEEAFNTCVARAQKIAYLQGLKDFSRMFIDLKDDATVILKQRPQ